MTFLKFTTIVHALLMSFQPWHGDHETETERSARMGVIAAAVTIASDQDRERAIRLLVQGRNETHFAEHVHAGRCEQHPDSFVGECDAVWLRHNGKRVRFYRARGIWQGHRAPRADIAALWDGALGSGFVPTLNAARLADFYLGARRCGGDLAKSYSAQGGIGCVVTPSGARRAKEHAMLRTQWARLEAGL